MSRAEALVIRTPRIEFGEAWDLQRRMVVARRAGAIPDLIWLLEHDPVFTTGKHGAREDLYLDDALLAARGARFYAIDRGGLMTWHGPGQSVAYVIHDLRGGGRIRPFVMALAESMAEAADLPGTAAGGDAMGAYRNGRKIGSVGVRVTGGVTMHGLALNRDPDLSWFQLMTACGAPDVEATSIAREGGDPDRPRVEAALAEGIADRLGLRTVPAAVDDLALTEPG
jgi:lipoate-protein ligase B